MCRLAQTLGLANMPLLPRKFSEAEWLELNHLLSGGDLSACTKAELETFATMLSRPRAIERVAGTSNFDAACNMIRTMLVVRMSEEQNEQAKQESRLALIISCIALVMATIQVIVGLWPLVYSSPIQVEASKALPIYAPSPIAALPAAPTPSAPLSQEKSTATPAPSMRTPTQYAPSPSAASSASSK